SNGAGSGRDEIIATSLVDSLNHCERRTRGGQSCRRFAVEADILDELSQLERPRSIATWILANRRVGRAHLRQHPVMGKALEHIAPTEPVDRDLAITTIDLEREEILPFGAAHVEERGLSARRPQGEEGV